MIALGAHQEESWGAPTTESAPELRPARKNEHLPHGGVFVPDLSLYEDLDIPTQTFQGCREIGAGAVRLTAEVPEEILDPVPALLFHGYCGSEKAYERLRNVIARNGKVAITYETPRVQSGFASLHPRHLGKPARLLSQAPWIVMKKGLEDPSEVADIDLTECQYDTYSHSMGGPTSVALALLHPERFRSLYLDQSAGLEPHNTPMMIARLGNFSNHELRKIHDPALLTHSLRLMARNPFKLAAEGIMVSNCNIRERLREIGELGIKTATVFGRNDSLISAHKSIEHSGHIPDLAGVHLDPRAHHLWPQTNPFDVAMAFQQVIGALNATEEDPVFRIAA
jgi:hypothetical protein